MILEAVARDFCNKNGYSHVRVLGSGTYKEVFLIESADSQQFALKILLEDDLRVDREIKAIRRFNHPCIGKIIDFGYHDFSGAPYRYLIEEFLDGGTLEQRISSSVLSIYDVFNIGKCLIEVLVQLEENKLVHRDIKPDNILFKIDSNIPILVDFGIVRDLTQVSMTQTFAAQGPCTPVFASPEQLNNDKNQITWKSDQFALGIVLSYCLIRTHPYQSAGENVLLAIEKVRTHAQPDQLNITKILHYGFKPIKKMVSPFASLRYREPNDLLNDWIQLEDTL